MLPTHALEPRRHHRGPGPMAPVWGPRVRRRKAAAEARRCLSANERGEGLPLGCGTWRFPTTRCRPWPTRPWTTSAPTTIPRRSTRRRRCWSAWRWPGRRAPAFPGASRDRASAGRSTWRASEEGFTGLRGTGGCPSSRRRCPRAEFPPRADPPRVSPVLPRELPGPLARHRWTGWSGPAPPASG